jgi:hypothetical protein
MTRHCTRCDAEVEDTGGYCLLGHPLRHTMETASLDDLRQEVEAAFESAADDVREALTPLIEQVENTPEPEPVYAAAVAAVPARYAPPAEPAGLARYAPPAEPAGVARYAPPSAPVAVLQYAPPAQPAVESKRPVPPPPPPQASQSKFKSLWEGMDSQAPLDRSDPINAFAPPPRMDWGPERSRGKGRGLRRLGFSNA